MKQRSRFLSGALIALLASTQLAWGAEKTVSKRSAKAKVAAGKKPTLKKPSIPKSAVPKPAAPKPVASEGMHLTLTTSLRAAPRTPPVKDTLPIQAPAVITTPAASLAPKPAAAPAAAIPTPIASVATKVIVPPPPARPASVDLPTYTPRLATPQGNPYLPQPLPTQPPPTQSMPAQMTASAISPAKVPAAVAIPIQPGQDESSSGFSFSSLGFSIPLLPDSGRDILPSINKVYPTGERPLVVVSFKCPTELVGITPPTIKILHDMVSLGMDGLNKTELLSFDLQQVCQ